MASNERGGHSGTNPLHSLSLFKADQHRESAAIAPGRTPAFGAKRVAHECHGSAWTGP